MDGTAMNFRGCGISHGNFSLGGWLDDVRAGVAHLHSLGASSVWLADPARVVRSPFVRAQGTLGSGVSQRWAHLLISTTGRVILDGY